MFTMRMISTSLLLLIYLVNVRATLRGSKSPSGLNSGTNHQSSQTINSTVKEPCDVFRPKSCSGFCGEFFNLPCSCDVYCGVYGRCCADFESVCSDEALKAKQIEENYKGVQTKCMTSSATEAPLLVISSCRENSTVDEIKACEQPGSTVTSSVTSKITGLHFWNVHCMVCNGEEEKDADYWNMFIGTDDRQDLPHIAASSFSKLFSNPILVSPNDTSKVNFCSPLVISTCLPRTTESLSNQCTGGPTSLVTVTSKKLVIFKNIYCVRCNINPTSLKYYTCLNSEARHFTRFRSPKYSFLIRWQGSSSLIIRNESYASRYIRLKEVVCKVTHRNVPDCTITKCSGILTQDKKLCLVDGNIPNCVSSVFHVKTEVSQEEAHHPVEKLGRDIELKLKRLFDAYINSLDVHKFIHSMVWLSNGTHQDGVYTFTVNIQNTVTLPSCNNSGKHPVTEYLSYIHDNMARFELDAESILVCPYTIQCRDVCSDINLKCPVIEHENNSTRINQTKPVSASPTIQFVYFVLYSFCLFISLFIF